MGQPPPNPLAEAMNRLWEKHLPQMRERVNTLQRAAESLANGTLTAAEQQEAAADAHKLAGVLGTFGLAHGTELAREAEALCESTLCGDPAAISRLGVIAGQLQGAIAGRCQNP